MAGRGDIEPCPIEHLLETYCAIVIKGLRIRLKVTLELFPTFNVPSHVIQEVFQFVTKIAAMWPLRAILLFLQFLFCHRFLDVRHILTALF